MDDFAHDMSIDEAYMINEKGGYIRRDDTDVWTLSYGDGNEYDIGPYEANEILKRVV